MEELKCGTGKIPKQGSLVRDCIVFFLLSDWLLLLQVRIRYSSGYLSMNGGEKVFNDFEKDTTLCFRLGRGEVMPGLEKGMKGENGLSLFPSLPRLLSPLLFLSFCLFFSLSLSLPLPPPHSFSVSFMLYIIWFLFPSSSPFPPTLSCYHLGMKPGGSRRIIIPPSQR